MITLLKWDDPDYEEEFLAKVELEHYHSFELNIERTRSTVIKSYLQGVPINLVRNFHPALKRHIHSWIAECNYEFIFVDHYEMFQYIPDNLQAKTIMYEHNAEFVMWKRYSEVTTSPLKKLLTRIEAHRIRSIEKAYCAKADMVLANPNDKEILSELVSGQGARARIEEIVPCGEDFMLDFPELQWDDTEESILYVGSLGWEANVDGLIWFLEEGWAKLKAKRPNIKFYIVGKSPDPRIEALAAPHEDVILTGFVEDLEDYYTKCRAFVTPLRFGSGVKLKVMNAMFRGMPVVTTPIGSEGMPVENGVHLYHTQNMDELVEYTAELMVNQQAWELLRSKSRELTRAHFSWAVQLNNIKENILSLGEQIEA